MSNRIGRMVAVAFCGIAPFIASATGLPPEEARKALTPAPGFEIQTAAAEPNSRQPVNIMFDERGRLWVMQYLQYPYPAGMKILSQDQWLRTTYNLEPLPPPMGVKGADRVTILESTHSDGHFDKATDFVTGLNLASSVEIGRGGVWVANAPYLLFYPDKDRKDVPDGNPQVILSGFGMEDAHAVVNHLSWGPDGWLYGAQGSTCTAHIEGHVFQQGAWRYNPRTKVFEVFSEGGGNTFGLDWDEHGNLFTGTNYSNFVIVHYVQGGYFVKNFGKHGELSNPYAFGFFNHAPHDGWHGGHVTQLGLMYQGGAFPTEFNGAWVTPRVLDNKVERNEVTAIGSTFSTRYAADLITSTDKRFRPVDIRSGPDGAIYVADWYDIRANHVIAKDDWEKDTGRIYRVAPKGLEFYKPFDLAKFTSDQLLDLLDNPNDWYSRTARRLLADRRDGSVVPRLKRMIAENHGRLALQSLWALYVSGGFDDALAANTLAHENPDVRAWTARLLCDEKHVSAEIEPKLIELARQEKSATVRMQLACSARRLPAEQAMPIVRELLAHSEDVTDRYIPLLLWWAIEDKAVAGREQVLALFQSPDAWKLPLVHDFILERLSRRYAVERTDANFAASGRLITMAPSAEDTGRIVAGMEKGLAGAALPAMPQSLKEPMEKLWARGPRTPVLVRLMLRLGLHEAQDEAVKLAGTLSEAKADRVVVIEILGQVGDPSCEPALIALLESKEPKEVRTAAVTALQRFDNPEVAQAVLARYAQMDKDLRSRTVSLLCGRVNWSAALLDAVEAGRIDRSNVSLDQVRQIALHDDKALNERVTKLWGSVQPLSSQEKQEVIDRVMRVLRHGKGEAAAGRPIFLQSCAVCHTLRREGGKIGPNLTAYDRTDLNFLVPNIVDPSASIRPEYATYTLRTKDRRVLNGPLVESTPQSVTIEDGTAHITIPRAQILSLESSPISRMPEKLLDVLTDQQIRDLFAFIAAEK